MKEHIFLCYVREDEKTVFEVYDFLLANDCKPWMDQYDIPIGFDFREAIDVAIEKAHRFIPCLSENFIRITEANRELRKALRILENYPEQSAFILPLRLEDCPVPRSLQRLNWLDWFKVDERPKLIKAVKARGSNLDGQ